MSNENQGPEKKTDSPSSFAQNLAVSFTLGIIGIVVLLVVIAFVIEPLVKRIF